MRKPAGLAALRLQRQAQWKTFAFLLLAFLPAIFAGVYLLGFASDRFVSVASFVVRTAAKPTGAGGFGALLQMVGFSRSDDDVFSVQDFLKSREAVESLGKELPLGKFFSRSGRDFLMAYPSFLYGGTREEFYKYIENFIDVSYNDTTGITTLSVQAFRPEEAYAMASKLLDIAEEKVNELNERIRSDAVRVAEGEVRRSEARLSDAMVQMTSFRNRQMMIDPAKSSVILSELIGRLGSDLAETQSLAAEKERGSPNDPGLQTLRQRAAALENQIETERSKIKSDSTGLADKLAAYERLTMERDFAKSALNRSLDALDAARTEARRQQLFLERVVNPNFPDYPTMPASLWTFFVVLALNSVAVMIAWLLRTGVREHAQIAET
ncbi:MAG TPA: capsule biosynthesis protein [Roseiarcus sp.]|nr:capsule biosynthesis protein [Roseiarcus sp.]